MVQPTLYPWAKFILFGFLVSLLSISRMLAQGPILRNELLHDLAKPRELAVNVPAMTSAIREADEPEMLASTPGFKNMGRGGQPRD